MVGVPRPCKAGALDRDRGWASDWIRNHRAAEGPSSLRSPVTDGSGRPTSWLFRLEALATLILLIVLLASALLVMIASFILIVVSFLVLANGAMLAFVMLVRVVALGVLALAWLHAGSASTD